MIQSALVLVFVVSASGRAQSCLVTGPAGTCAAAISLATPATITNPRIVRLSAAPASTSVTASIADYDRTPSGFVAFTGPTFTVSANRTWSLSVNATTATWTGSGALARSTKPVSDLTWSTGSNGTFVPMTASPASFASGGATSGAGSTLFFHSAISWAADPPGSYVLTIQVTVATP